MDGKEEDRHSSSAKSCKLVGTRADDGNSTHEAQSSMEVDTNIVDGISRPALTRLASEADYSIQGTYTVDTRDYEDHTFSGIMFDVVCKDTLPIQNLELTHVYVRGALGDMQIFTCTDSIRGPEPRGETRALSLKQGAKVEKHLDPEQWRCVHKETHQPSTDELKAMKLSPPVIVTPGKTIGLYVHSRAAHDQAIVYNNRRSEVTYEDRHFRVMPGLAHVSNIPFSKSCVWGYAWRDGREFVGRLKYAVKWKLWKPSNHALFPRCFREMVIVLLRCHKHRGSSLSILPKRVLLYIINFCAYDWAGIPEEVTSVLRINDLQQQARRRRDEAIRIQREREYRRAQSLKERGTNLITKNKFIQAANECSQALAILQNGAGARRRKILFVETMSQLSECCLRIGQGLDVSLSRMLDEMEDSKMRRENELHSHLRFLEQGATYGLILLSKINRITDSKFVARSHHIVAESRLQFGRLARQLRSLQLEESKGDEGKDRPATALSGLQDSSSPPPARRTHIMQEESALHAFRMAAAHYSSILHLNPDDSKAQSGLREARRVIEEMGHNAEKGNDEAEEEEEEDDGEEDGGGGEAERNEAESCRC